MGTARGAALAEHPFAGSQDNIKATCSQLHFPMRPKRRSGRKRMRSQLFLEELPREQEPCVVIFVLSVSFPLGPRALRGSCPPADMNSFQSLCTTLRFQVWAETPPPCSTCRLSGPTLELFHWQHLLFGEVPQRGDGYSGWKPTTQRSEEGQREEVRVRTATAAHLELNEGEERKTRFGLDHPTYNPPRPPTPILAGARRCQEQVSSLINAAACAKSAERHCKLETGFPSSQSFEEASATGQGALSTFLG